MKKTESETDSTQAQETLNDLMHTKDSVNARLLRDTKCMADLTSQFSSVEDELRDAVEQTLKDIRMEFDKRKKRVSPGIKRMEDTLKSLHKSEVVLKNKERQCRNSDMKRAKRRIKDAELSLLECNIPDHDSALYTIAVGHIMSLNQTLMQIPINWKLHSDQANRQKTPTPRLGDSEDYDSEDLTPRWSPHIVRRGSVKSPKPKSRSADRTTKRSPRRSSELATTKLSIPTYTRREFRATANTNENGYPSDKKLCSLDGVDFFSSDPDTNDEGFHTSEMASNTSQYLEDIDFSPSQHSREKDQRHKDNSKSLDTESHKTHVENRMNTSESSMFLKYKRDVKNKRSKSTPPYTSNRDHVDVSHKPSKRSETYISQANQWISPESIFDTKLSNDTANVSHHDGYRPDPASIDTETSNRKERSEAHATYETHSYETNATTNMETSHVSSKTSQRRSLPSVPGQISLTTVPISDKEAADGLSSLATTIDGSGRGHRGNMVSMGNMEYIDPAFLDTEDAMFNETVKTARREIIERLKSRYAITTGQKAGGGQETHKHSTAKTSHGRHSRKPRGGRKDHTSKLLRRESNQVANDPASPLRKYKSTPSLYEEFEKATRTTNNVKSESHGRSRSPAKRLYHSHLRSNSGDSTTLHPVNDVLEMNKPTKMPPIAKGMPNKQTVNIYSPAGAGKYDGNIGGTSYGHQQSEQESLVERNINRFEEAAIRQFNGNAMHNARSQRQLLNMRSRSLSTSRKPIMGPNYTQPSPKALQPRNMSDSSHNDENDKTPLRLNLKYDTETELDSICSGHSARTIRRQWRHRRSSSLTPHIGNTPVERISRPMFKFETSFVLPERAKNSTCCISGIACLHNELVVLLDENNKHLHLIDEELLHRHLYSETDVAVSICSMESNSFAVAIPYRFCVRFYTTSNCKISLKRDVEIKCKEWVTSVCHENQLLYAMCKGGHVHVTDYRGREQKRIETGIKGRLTVGPSGRRFYVSGDGRLTRINADGAMMWSRTDLTSDTTLLHKDTLYVVDKKRKVLVSLAEFSGVRDLFREEVDSPSAVCMSHTEQMLYISQYTNSMDTVATRTISVFCFNRK